MKGAHYLLLLLALPALSMSAPLVRLVAAPAAAVVFWRLTLASPVLASLALARRDVWPWKVAIPGGIFFALHLLFWVVAVQNTTIASAAVLGCSGALWAAFLSKPLLKEPVTARLWAGIVIGLIGVGIIVSAQNTGRHTLYGDLFGLASALAWVGYTFVGRKARRDSAFAGYTSAMYMTCALVALLTALLLRQPLWPTTSASWLALAGLVLLPTLLGHGSMNYLLRHLGPTRLSLWILAEPAIASFVGWLMYGEWPGPQIVIGGLVTLLGVGLGAWERPLRPPKEVASLAA